jgi:predicted kinase
MEAILFMGVQASGKSSFYRERFFRTHLRLNLDMLKNRNREWRLLEACLDSDTRFVLDNTNPTRAERQTLIEAAKARRFHVIGYYFQSQVEGCKLRNEQRPADERVPLAGLLATYARLELPSWDEGFDKLHYVQMAETGFDVEDWQRAEEATERETS